VRGTRFCTFALVSLVGWALLAGSARAQMPVMAPSGNPVGVLPGHPQVLPAGVIVGSGPLGALPAGATLLGEQEHVVAEHAPLEGLDGQVLYGGLWRARTDYLYIHREVSDYVVFSRRLLDDVGPVAIDRDSIEFEPENGLRVAVERRMGERDSIEGVFYGVEDWDFLHARQDPANLLFSDLRLELGGPVPGFDQAFIHELEFTSDFVNFELNYWRPLRRKILRTFDVSLMLGLRYTALDEELSYRARAKIYNNVPTLNVIHAEMYTRTENDIYGFQLGWLVTAPLAPAWIMRWDGKVAAGVNFAKQHTRLFEDFTPTIHNEVIRNDVAAVVGDSLVTINWQITCNFTVYVGYQVVFLEGVALAPEQFNPIFSPFRDPRLDHNGFLFMQAAVGGAEIVW